MKKFVIIASILFSTLSFAQDFDLVQASSEEKEIADQVAEKFESELGLTSKQQVLFSKNYAEFIAKKNEVLKSDRTMDDKNTVLLALYREQAKELNDILTKPQRVRFQKIREQYDPLIQMVEKK